MTAARRETRMYYSFLSFKYNFGSASGFSGSHFTGECEVGRVYAVHCAACVNVPYIKYTRLTKPSKVKTVHNSAHNTYSDVPNIIYLQGASMHTHTPLLQNSTHHAVILSD